MKTLFPLILSTLLSLTTAAQAADLVVTTGKTGGGYNAVGERLKTVMAEQGVSVEVLTSVGSLENLKRLDDPNNPANVGLTQADAIKYYLAEHPDFANKLFTLGEIGKECVFIVTGKDSNLDSDADLLNKQGNLLAIADPNSGAAVTYSYMIRLEPKFQNTPVTFVDTMEALLRIKTGGQENKTKAVMFVQGPTVKSPQMQVVLDNPKAFRFIPVTNRHLDDKLPDRSAVYTFETVTVQQGRWFDTKVDTICTRGLLIGAKDKLSPELRSRLAQLMLLSGSRVLGDKQ